MKRFRQILLASSFFFGWCLTEIAHAHDGWIEVAPLVETGQPVTIALFLGNHSNDHKSYRLAGKWERKFTKLLVIGPSGKVDDITASLIDLGEDEEQTGPKGPKGFHVATFTPKEPGTYNVVAREEQIRQYDGPKFRGVRSARAAFSALRNPRVAEGRKLTGYGRTFAIDNLMEIVPISSPIAVIHGDRVTLELRYKGKPFPAQTVTIIRRRDGPSGVENLVTDQNGRISFIAPAVDYYLVRAKYDERNDRREGEYDLSSYEASLAFQIFNRP